MSNIKRKSLKNLSILYLLILIAHKTFGQNVLKWKLPSLIKIMVIVKISFIQNSQPSLLF